MCLDRPLIARLSVQIAVVRTERNPFSLMLMMIIFMIADNIAFSAQLNWLGAAGPDGRTCFSFARMPFRHAIKVMWSSAAEQVRYDLSFVDCWLLLLLKPDSGVHYVDDSSIIIISY